MTRRPRLDSLTSLRYLAALLVVLYHTGPIFLRGTYANKLLANGYIGVTFFFVLSGFVLTWSRRPRTDAPTFYAHRFARGWPLHALTWLTMLVLLGPSHTFPGVGPTLSNLLLLHDWIPKSSYYFSVNGPSWTLSCELFFYLFFPATISLVADLERRRLAHLSGILAVVLVIGALVVLGLVHATGHPGVLYLVHEFPLYRFGQFLLGVLLALLVERGWRPRVSVIPALVLTIAPAVAVTIVTGSAGSQIVIDIITLPGIWLLVVAGAVNDLTGRGALLRRRTAVRLGQWSFALYLIQAPALTVAARLGVQAQTDVVDEITAVVGLTILSAAVFIAFERPVERWLRPRLTSDAARPRPMPLAHPE